MAMLRLIALLACSTAALIVGAHSDLTPQELAMAEVAWR
jgi:hypothetical protein